MTGYEWVVFNGCKKQHLASHLFGAASQTPIYHSMCGVTSYAWPAKDEPRCKKCLAIEKRCQSREG